MLRLSQSDPRGRFAFLRLHLIGLVAGFAVVAAGIGAWLWHTTRPDYVLEQGEEALRRGDSDAAWDRLDALEGREFHDHAALLRAQIRFQEKRFHDALLALSLIDRTSPLHLEAVGWSGRCLLELGDHVQAEQTFGYLLDQRPDDVNGHRGLAAVYYDIGAYPLAAAHCADWAKLDPKSGAPHRFRGVMFKDMYQFSEAVEEFRAALQRELTPQQRDEVRLELAGSLFKQGLFAEALAELEPLAAAGPSDLPVLELKSEILRGLDRGQEAAELTDRILKRDPDNVAALRLRGLLHLDQGQAAQAAPLLERAAARAPTNYLVRLHLASAYNVLGKTDVGKKHQERAKEIESAMRGLTDLTRELHKSPRDPVLHRRMAALYDQLDMNDHAVKSRRLAAMFEKSESK